MVETLSCPFHLQCQFHNTPLNTPSDVMLREFLCHQKYEECEIAQKILADMPVRAGARPDVHI